MSSPREEAQARRGQNRMEELALLPPPTARVRELCEAIRARDVDAVRRLLSQGTPLNVLVDKTTPLHVLCSAFPETKNPLEMTIMEAMLAKAQGKSDVLNCRDKCERTPIHIAITRNDLYTVKNLVSAGADTENIRLSGQTALHVAAEMTRIDIVRYLTQTKYTGNLNVLDAEGKTPLWYAAHFGDETLCKFLLCNGATLSVKEEKESAIDPIAKFNNSLTFFEDIFDKCIYEANSCFIVDYKVLAGPKYAGVSQIKVLEDLVRFGQSKILKHPTIESLIYFKWKCLQPVYCLILVVYVLFLLSFNIFVITTFYNMDTSRTTYNTTLPTDDPDVRSCGWQHWPLIVLLWLSTVILILKECLCLQGRRLWKLDTWVNLGALLLAFIMSVLMLNCNSSPDDMRWQRNFTCVALLLAWLQAMLLLSRFPGWGYYVLMLERVAINILKILATTIFLVIGFSTCLMIQYQSKPPFDGPVAAFIKTLVMMLSEFDYGDLFNESHDDVVKNTIIELRLLFVLFVIFIAIVLMNFVIGVAVSDVNELNDIAKIRTLEKQVELLSILERLGDTFLAKQWECLGDTFLAKCWRPFSGRKLTLIRFHDRMERSSRQPGTSWTVDYDGVTETFPSETHNAIQVIPDGVKETFPSELHNAILNIAKKTRQNVDKLDAVYDAVVGTPRHTHNNVSIVSSAPVTTTLNDRMKSIEDANKKIKRSLDDFNKNMNDKYDKIVGIMADGKKDMNDMNDKCDKILGIMAGGMK